MEQDGGKGHGSLICCPLFCQFVFRAKSKSSQPENCLPALHHVLPSGLTEPPMGRGGVGSRIVWVGWGG